MNGCCLIYFRDLAIACILKHNFKTVSGILFVFSLHRPMAWMKSLFRPWTEGVSQKRNQLTSPWDVPLEIWSRYSRAPPFFKDTWCLQTKIYYGPENDSSPIGDCSVGRAELLKPNFVNLGSVASSHYVNSLMWISILFLFLCRSTKMATNSP